MVLCELFEGGSLPLNFFIVIVNKTRIKWDDSVKLLCILCKDGHGVSSPALSWLVGERSREIPVSLRLWFEFWVPTVLPRKFLLKLFTNHEVWMKSKNITTPLSSPFLLPQLRFMPWLSCPHLWLWGILYAALLHAFDPYTKSEVQRGRWVHRTVAGVS